MSLINEALKRTRDAKFQAGNARPTTVETYRVASREDSSALGTRSGVWVSLLVLVMAAVAVLVFALRVVKPGQDVRQALNVNAEEAAPLPVLPPVVVKKVEPVIVPATTVKHEEPQAPVVVAAVPAAPAATTPVVPTPAPAPELTKFVLQGIISAATWREATVNGYAVREGDEVDGAKVIAIESRRVKLQLGDREILLRMP